MKISEEVPGTFIAVVDAPATPALLAELAGKLPAGVVLETVEIDYDGSGLVPGLLTDRK